MLQVQLKIVRCRWQRLLSRCILKRSVIFDFDLLVLTDSIWHMFAHTIKTAVYIRFVYLSINPNDDTFYFFFIVTVGSFLKVSYSFVRQRECESRSHWRYIHFTICFTTAIEYKTNRWALNPFAAQRLHGSVFVISISCMCVCVCTTAPKITTIFNVREKAMPTLTASECIQ